MLRETAIRMYNHSCRTNALMFVANRLTIMVSTGQRFITPRYTGKIARILKGIASVEIRRGMPQYRRLNRQARPAALVERARQAMNLC